MTKTEKELCDYVEALVDRLDASTKDNTPAVYKKAR